MEPITEIPDAFFTLVILPLLIFTARITEVSVNTLRIIYMLGGRKYIATILGFFEASIWLVAMRQIFQHLDSWLYSFMYALGFAAGIFAGMLIEERIAFGKVIVRIITPRDPGPLITYLNKKGFRHTLVHATGPDGEENLIFLVLEREHLDLVIGKVRALLPQAFYTIESVKAADEPIATATAQRELKAFSWLRGIVNP